MISFHDDSTGVVIHHNGDFSGDAWICYQGPVDGEYTDNPFEMRVPCSALLRFARRSVISEIVGVIEQME